MWNIFLFHVGNCFSNELMPCFVDDSGHAIRKASFFAGERKRDSEEIVLLKMVYLGGGRHPVKAVRSTQLTRRVVWADSLNSLLGPGRRGISWGQWGAHNWPGAHSGWTRSAARPRGKCWFFCLKSSSSIRLTVWNPRNNREERESMMQALTLLLSDLWLVSKGRCVWNRIIQVLGRYSMI